MSRLLGERSDAWFRDVFACDVVDLGASDPRLEGILAPQTAKSERTGITDQFLEHAETYDAIYSNAAHFQDLFEKAFRATGYSPQPDAAILDIGCGSGANSVVPCLKLFPNCRIVASDLSPDLLRMLRAYLRAEKLEDRVACFCADAMDDHLRPGTFDVVVGAAILHHIINPLQTLKAASNALRRGGIAIFFEPFEGMALLRIAFSLVLEQSGREREPVSEKVANFLKMMIRDIEVRTGTDKSAEFYRYIDDKWLFTRSYIEAAAAAAQFSSVRIVPHAYHATCIHDYVANLLRLGIQERPTALPDWAWTTIDAFDQVFSTEMKADLSFEATIVLQK